MRTFATMDFATDAETTTALAAANHTDQASIADMKVTTFQASVNETVNPETARKLHQTAQAQTYALDSLLTERRSDVRNGHGLPDDVVPEHAADRGGDGRGE